LSTHGELFKGPISGPQTEPTWPGYDKQAAARSKLGVLARLFRRRAGGRHAA
jgi:hypothetical protein